MCFATDLIISMLQNIIFLIKYQIIGKFKDAARDSLVFISTQIRLDSS